MKALALTAGILTAMYVPTQTPAKASGTAQATINVLPYLYVQFNSSAPVTFLILDGGKASAYSQNAGFTVLSNVGYRLITYLNPPTTAAGVPAPGSFSARTNLVGVQAPTGGQAGTLTVTVSGLTISNTLIGDYTTGGSALIQVVDAN